ncbi:MAG: hypothetical protein J0M07_03805 [Anaerolineae bacterium]|nr:hypothetical protein [Anaerolineae bacterium]
MKIQTPDTTPEVIRNHIRALTKMMIGDDDRTGEQVKPIRREDLAADMRDKEGHVLDAIYACAWGENPIPPTEDNVIGVLRINQRLPEPDAFVKALLKEHKDDTHGIRSLSAFIAFWMKERVLRQAATMINTIANDPYMDYKDKWDRSRKVLEMASPVDSFTYSNVSEEELKMLTLRESKAIREARESGLGYGVTLPFEAFNAYFPYLEYGQGTAILGQEGIGKTTVGIITAEHIAWNSKAKLDVSYMACETPLHVLSRRQFSRHNLVTYNDIKEGRIDLESGEWSTRWKKWLDDTRLRSNEYGHINFFYGPEATADDILSQMSISAETSRRLGRGMVFVLDHLHSINWRATHREYGEFEALRMIALSLFARVNSIYASGVNTHLFMLAQEGDIRGQAFGNKFISKRAQLVISLQRERFGERGDDGEFPGAAADFKMTKKAHELTDAQKNSPWYRKSKDDTGAYEMLDALGQPRYWYRAGSKFGSKGTMYCSKSNDSQPATVNTIWDAEMNRIIQDPGQVADLRKSGRLKPSGVK